MSTDQAYKDGDIVWVKLGNNWWPGEVIDVQRHPDGTVSNIKRKLYCIVKFFNEDAYEYVSNVKQIYPFQCAKKEEFLKKGFALYNSGNKFMEKFPEDVKIAERLTSQKTPSLYINDRPDSIVKAVLGQPIILGGHDGGGGNDGRGGSGNNSTDFREKRRSCESITKIMNITPNRSMLAQPTPSLSSLSSSIRFEHSSSSSSSSSNNAKNINISTGGDSITNRFNTSSSNNTNNNNNYRCNLCGFTSVRQNVMILHRKSHSNRNSIGSSIGNVKPMTSPNQNKTNIIDTKVANKINVLKPPILSNTTTTTKNTSSTSIDINDSKITTTKTTLPATAAGTRVKTNKLAAVVDNLNSTKPLLSSSTPAILVSDTSSSELDISSVETHSRRSSRRHTRTSASKTPPPTSPVTVAVVNTNLTPTTSTLGGVLNGSKTTKLADFPEAATKPIKKIPKKRDFASLHIQQQEEEEERTTTTVAIEEAEEDVTSGDLAKATNSSSFENKTPSSTMVGGGNVEEIRNMLLADWSDEDETPDHDNHDDDAGKENKTEVATTKSTIEGSAVVLTTATTSTPDISKSQNTSRIRNIPKKDRRNVILDDFNNDLSIIEPPPPTTMMMASSAEINLVDSSNSSTAEVAEKQEISTVITINDDADDDEGRCKSKPASNLNNNAELLKLHRCDLENVEPNDKSLSCFDFQDDEEEQSVDVDNHTNAVNPSVAHFKKKYLSNEKSHHQQGAIEDDSEKQHLEERAKQDQELAAEIESLLEQTQPPAAADLIISRKTSFEEGSSIAVKDLPIKERSKRIFKSRNRSRIVESKSSTESLTNSLNSTDESLTKDNSSSGGKTDDGGGQEETRTRCSARNEKVGVTEQKQKKIHEVPNGKNGREESKKEIPTQIFNDQSPENLVEASTIQTLTELAGLVENEPEEEEEEMEIVDKQHLDNKRRRSIAIFGLDDDDDLSMAIKQENVITEEATEKNSKDGAKLDDERVIEESPENSYHEIDDNEVEIQEKEQEIEGKEQKITEEENEIEDRPQAIEEEETQEIEENAPNIAEEEEDVQEIIEKDNEPEENQQENTQKDTDIEEVIVISNQESPEANQVLLEETNMQDLDKSDEVIEEKEGENLVTENVHKAIEKTTEHESEVSSEIPSIILETPKENNETEVQQISPEEMLPRQSVNTPPVDENSSLCASDTGAEFGSPASMLSEERLPAFPFSRNETPQPPMETNDDITLEESNEEELKKAVEKVSNDSFETKENSLQTSNSRRRRRQGGKSTSKRKDLLKRSAERLKITKNAEVEEEVVNLLDNQEISSDIKIQKKEADAYVESNYCENKTTKETNRTELGREKGSHENLKFKEDVSTESTGKTIETSETPENNDEYALKNPEHITEVSTETHILPQKPLETIELEVPNKESDANETEFKAVEHEDSESNANTNIREEHEEEENLKESSTRDNRQEKTCSIQHKPLDPIDDKEIGTLEELKELKKSIEENSDRSAKITNEFVEETEMSDGRRLIEDKTAESEVSDTLATDREVKETRETPTPDLQNEADAKEEENVQWFESDLKETTTDIPTAESLGTEPDVAQEKPSIAEKEVPQETSEISTTLKNSEKVTETNGSSEAENREKSKTPTIQEELSKSHTTSKKRGGDKILPIKSKQRRRDDKSNDESKIKSPEDTETCLPSNIDEERPLESVDDIITDCKVPKTAKNNRIDLSEETKCENDFVEKQSSTIESHKDIKESQEELKASNDVDVEVHEKAQNALASAGDENTPSDNDKIKKLVKTTTSTIEITAATTKEYLQDFDTLINQNKPPEQTTQKIADSEDFMKNIIIEVQMDNNLSGRIDTTTKTSTTPPTSSVDKPKPKSAISQKRNQHNKTIKRRQTISFDSTAMQCSRKGEVYDFEESSITNIAGITSLKRTAERKMTMPDIDRITRPCDFAKEKKTATTTPTFKSRRRSSVEDNITSFLMQRPNSGGGGDEINAGDEDLFRDLVDDESSSRLSTDSSNVNTIERQQQCSKLLTNHDVKLNNRISLATTTCNTSTPNGRNMKRKASQNNKRSAAADNPPQNKILRETAGQPTTPPPDHLKISDNQISTAQQQLIQLQQQQPQNQSSSSIILNAQTTNRTRKTHKSTAAATTSHSPPPPTPQNGNQLVLPQQQQPQHQQITQLASPQNIVLQPVPPQQANEGFIITTTSSREDENVIDQNTQLIALPTQPYPGYTETFLLCKVNGNTCKPVDNVPLYLNHQLNELVPIPAEVLEAGPKFIVADTNLNAAKDDGSTQEAIMLQQHKSHDADEIHNMHKHDNSSTMLHDGSTEEEDGGDTGGREGIDDEEAMQQDFLDEANTSANEDAGNNGILLNIEGQQVLLDAATFAHLLANPDTNTQLISEDGTEYVLTHEVLQALYMQQQQQQQQHQHHQQQHEQQEHQVLEIANAAGVNNDIIAVAMAGSDLYDNGVLTIDTTQALQLIEAGSVVDGPEGAVIFQQATPTPATPLVPPPHLTPPAVVTNAVLDQSPIMSTLEVPSLSRLHTGPSHCITAIPSSSALSNAAAPSNVVIGAGGEGPPTNLDDSLAAIGVTAQSSSISSSLGLPITVTDPNIASKVTSAGPLNEILQFVSHRPATSQATAAALATAALAGESRIFND